MQNCSDHYTNTLDPAQNPTLTYLAIVCATPETQLSVLPSYNKNPSSSAVHSIH